MTNEEAKAFLDNLKICIDEHPIVADWLVEIANRKTEPQTDLLVTEYPQDGEVNLIGRDKTEAVVMAYDVYKELTEPQTEMEKSGSRAVQTARCLNCHNAKACKENHWEVCRYEPWKLIAVDDEPQTDCSWR